MNVITEKLLDFIERSPSCFHAVENLKKELLSKGFVELKENESWNFGTNRRFFVTRNNSSIISFVIPAVEKGEDTSDMGFMICASHSDSPCFKIKENPEIKGSGFVRLNVEKYGGMLMNPWFDRPLGIAGRIVTSKEKDGKCCFNQILVDFEKNMAMIPNLAIHFNRDANDGHRINVQKELQPVVSADAGFNLKKELAKKAGVTEEEILSYDLFLYNRDKGTVWGSSDEFISSPKLDDLECVYTTFEGFLTAAEKFEDAGNCDSCRRDEIQKNLLVHAVFDNEETGSQSRQGAGGTFLYDVLHRINTTLGRTEEQYFTSVAKSFLISADNAHSVHPDYAESSDPVNQPKVNGGPVIKFNAAQKYTTDSVSAAVFKKICQKAEVPFQIFTNNSNVAGGSTLGNISVSQVSVLSVDIGIAQWAMHSPNESAGSRDPEFMTKAIAEFYGSSLEF